MSRPSDELLHVAKLMREALATCILPWFGKLTADQVGEKGPEDFVTIADTSAELFLGARLVEFRPGSRIIGEEGVAANPALLQTLADGACWIIDPVDGTWLFKHSLPHFGTLVSRSRDGVTQAGWVLETYLDENGVLENRILMGDAASGVWHSPTNDAPFEQLKPFAERTIDASRPVSVFNAEDFVTGFVRTDSADYIAGQSAPFAWSDELYSSASIYSALLRGEAMVHFAAGAYPWDHSAGMFLMRLLGGTARHLTLDRDYHPDQIGHGIAVAYTEPMYRKALVDMFLPRPQWPQRDPDIRKA